MNTKRLINYGSIKNIMLLKGAKMYDEYLKLVEQQNKLVSSGAWKIAIPTIASIAALGVAAFEYVTMRIKNEQCYDAAERLINEATAYNEMNMKGSK